MDNDHPVKVYLWQMLKAMFAFGCVVLYSRYLGTSGRGQLSIYLLNLQVVLMINELFVGSAQANWFAKYGLRRFLPRILSVSTLITTGALGLGFFLIEDFNSNVYGYLFLWGWVLILQNVISNYWQSKGWVIQKNQMLLVFEVLKAMALASLILGIVNAAYGVASLLRILVISGFVWVVIYGIKLIKRGGLKVSPFSKFDIAHTWGEGIWAQMGQISLFFIYRLPLYLAAEWIDDSAAGILSNALLVIDSLWIFANSLGGVLHSRIINNPNKAYALSQLGRFVTWSFLGTFILGLMAFALPPFFYEWIFGKGFGAMASYIRWMTPGLLALGLFASMGNYLHALNEFKRLFVHHLLGLSIMVVFIFTLRLQSVDIQIVNLLWIYNLGLIVVALLHFLTIYKRGFTFSFIYRNVLLNIKLIRKVVTPKKG